MTQRGDDIEINTKSDHDINFDALESDVISVGRRRVKETANFRLSRTKEARN